VKPLPSIASVARLSLVSRCAGADHAWVVNARDGELSARPRPLAWDWHQRRGARLVFQCAGTGANSCAPKPTEYQHIVRMHGTAALSRFDVAFAACSQRQEMSGAWPPRRAAPSAWIGVAKICGEEFAAHVDRVTA